MAPTLKEPLTWEGMGKIFWRPRRLSLWEWPVDWYHFQPNKSRWTVPLRNNYWLILFWTPINPRKTLPLKTESFNAGHNEIMSWAVHLCRKWNEERIVIHAGFYLRCTRSFRSNISVEDVSTKYLVVLYLYAENESNQLTTVHLNRVSVLI